MEAVHAAIIEAFKVSPVHRNVSLVLHAPHRFIGRTDCPNPDRLTNISIFLLPGRSLAAKRLLYRSLVRRLEAFEIMHDEHAATVEIKLGQGAKDEVTRFDPALPGADRAALIKRP